MLEITTSRIETEEGYPGTEICVNGVNVVTPVNCTVSEIAVREAPGSGWRYIIEFDVDMGFGPEYRGYGFNL